MTKPSYMVDRDCSSDMYIQDSEDIKERIREEIAHGEYNKTVYYYGITELEPCVEEVSNGHRYRVCRANNCVYPERYTNVMVNVPREKLIHWFVVVK